MDPTQRRRIEETLDRAATDLEVWRETLRALAEKLPDPAWDEESGEPTNLSAAWQLGLEVQVDEPLDVAIRWLRWAAEWDAERFGGSPPGDAPPNEPTDESV